MPLHPHFPISCHASAEDIPRPCAVPVTQSLHPMLWHGRGSDGLLRLSPHTVRGIPCHCMVEVTSSPCAIPIKHLMPPAALCCPHPTTKVTQKLLCHPCPTSKGIPCQGPILGHARREGDWPVPCSWLLVMCRWPRSYLWGWATGRVTFSRCDLAHRDTAAQVTPCDLPWGGPGAAKAAACRGDEVFWGVPLGGLRTMLFCK